MVDTTSPRNVSQVMPQPSPADPRAGELAQPNSFLKAQTPQPVLEQPATEAPQGGLAGAAFRTSNDFGAFMDLAFGPSFKPDPTFDAAAAARTSPYYTDYGYELATAGSATEFYYRQAKIARELKDKEFLAGQGWKGVVAGMGMGLISPTTLIPFIGEARGVKGVGQAFMNAGLMATEQSSLLYMASETGTPEDLGFGIAAGTVLGGLLGSAHVYLRPPMAANIARDLEPSNLGAARAVSVRGKDGSVVRLGEDGALDVPHVHEPLAREVSPNLTETKVVVGPDGVREAPHYVADNLPPPKEGFVRLYHGTPVDGISPSVGGDRAVTTSLQYAHDYRSTNGKGEVWYIDVPKDSPILKPIFDQVDVENNTSMVGRYHSTDIPEEMTPLMQKVPLNEGTVKLESRPEGLSAQSSAEKFVPILPHLDPVTNEITYAPAYEGPVREAGRMAPATGIQWLDNALAWLNPVARSVNQGDHVIEAPGVRRAMLSLSDGGLSYEGADLGIVGAAEGNIEHRTAHYQALLARGLRLFESSYIDYILGKGASQSLSGVAKGKVLSLLNKAGKDKLSYVQFSEAMTDAMNLNDTSHIPEVTAAARAIRRDVMEVVNTAAREAEDVVGTGQKLYHELKTSLDQSYMRHDFSPDLIRGDRTGFINMVSSHYNSVMTAYYQRRIAKLMDRTGQTEEYAKILQMNTEEAKALYDSMGEALKLTKPYTSEQDAIINAIDNLEWTKRNVHDDILENLVDGFKGTAEELRMEMPQIEAKAKELADEEVKQIDAQIEKLWAEAPPRLEADAKEVSKMRRIRSFANRAMGALQARQDKALEQIIKNEDLTMRNIEEFGKKWTKLQGEKAKITPEAYQGELRKLMTQLDSAFKLVKQSEKKIVKHQAEIDAGVKEGAANMSDADVLLEYRLKRLNGLFDKYDEAAAKTPADLEAAVNSRIKDAKEYLAKAVQRRAERNVKLMKDAEGKFNPDLAKQRVTSLMDDIMKRQEALLESIHQAGGEHPDLATGQMDFTAVSKNMATEIADRITGNVKRMAQVDLLNAFEVGRRSPMKARVLDIPYDIKKRYLNMNFPEVLKKYIETVGPDIELFRATGDRTGGVLLKNLQNEMGKIKDLIETRTVDEKGKPITDARRMKERRQHDIAWKRREAEMAGVIERIRGLRGLPSDPNSFGQRLGRAFLNLNTATMGGTFAISGLNDASRAIFSGGMMNTFHDGWKPFIQGLIDESKRPISDALRHELRLAGVALEVTNHTRAKAWTEDLGYSISQSRFEKFLQNAAHSMPTLALYGPVTDVIKQATGSMTMAKMIRSMERLTDGKWTKDDLRYLTDLNISPEYAQRIVAMLRSQEGGTKWNGVTIPNTESWTDYAAKRVYYAAMAREDARLVVTPGAEKSLWLDGSMGGRILGQFHSFVNSSHSKILLSGLQSRDMAAFRTAQGAVFSLALGSLSYYIWAMTNGEKSRTEMQNASAADWIDQSLARSGILGALSDVQTLMQRIPLTSPFSSFGAVFDGNTKIQGKGANNMADQILGSSFSSFETILQIVAGMGDPTQGTVHQVRKLLPWQNVFYLKEVFNAVEQGVAQYFPKTRN